MNSSKSYITICISIIFGKNLPKSKNEHIDQEIKLLFNHRPGSFDTILVPFSTSRMDAIRGTQSQKNEKSFTQALARSSVYNRELWRHNPNQVSTSYIASRIDFSVQSQQQRALQRHLVIIRWVSTFSFSRIFVTWMSNMTTERWKTILENDEKMKNKLFIKFFPHFIGLSKMHYAALMNFVKRSCTRRYFFQILSHKTNTNATTFSSLQNIYKVEFNMQT